MGRIVVRDYPHHVTQRGNYKNIVFTNKSDYERYLAWLNIYSQKYGLLFLTYSLMPNHVHFIAIPTKDNSMAKTFNTCHMIYSQYFNKKKNACGHLWQGRFYSNALDENHLYAAVRYIENNPVRAGLVAAPEDWEWSSARHHLTGNNPGLNLLDFSKYMEIDNWRDYLAEPDDADVIKNFKANTLTGRPLGSDTFVDKIETMFDRTLKSARRGRPKKVTEK